MQGVAEWTGLTASVGFVSADGPGAYTAADIRPQLLATLGFQNPPAIEKMAEPGAFSVYFSEDALEPLDADLFICIDASGNFSPIETLASCPFLTAERERRDIHGQGNHWCVFHATPLSLLRAIDIIVPMMKTALDGDPTTHADAPGRFVRAIEERMIISYLNRHSHYVTQAVIGAAAAKANYVHIL